MKITRRRLRKIIKEESKKLIYESYMKQRFTEMSDVVLMIIENEPGISGLDLVATVGDEYPSSEMPVEREEVFTILDIMQEEGEVVFDTAEDAWYIAGSPEAVELAGGIPSAEDEFIDQGIQAREMMRGRR